MNSPPESNANSNKEAIVASDWENFCCRATLHGLSEFYNERHPLLKSLYLLCVLSALIGSLYGSYEIINEYMKNQIAVSYTVEHNNTVQLPDVVLCPFSTLSTNFMHDKNISDRLADYIVDAFGNSVLYDGKFYRPIGDELRTELDVELNETLLRLNMTWETFLLTSSIRCEDFVADCYAVDDPEELYGVNSCCSTATHGLWTTFGDCIRLPGPWQSVPGFGWGLTLLLRPLNGDVVHEGRSTLMNDGISIYFSESGKEHLTGYTFVPSGIHALLPLKVVHYELLNAPPSAACSADAAAGRRDTQMCMDYCFFAEAIEKCACYPLALRAGVDPIAGYVPCTPKMYESCILPELGLKITEMGNSAIITTCRQRCPDPCAYKEFLPRLSFASFPSRGIQKYLREMENLTDFTVLSIYYEELGVTKIHHFLAISLQQFLASVGGQLSLYAGGSIVTLVQLVVFLGKLSFTSPFFPRMRNVFKKFRRRRTPMAEKKSEEIVSQSALLAERSDVDRLN